MSNARRSIRLYIKLQLKCFACEPHSEYPLKVDFSAQFTNREKNIRKQIIDATDAKIVLSTSWREHWEKDLAKCDSTGALINSIFSKHGLQIWDKTPQLRTKRETQIKSWLDRHPEVKNFVVLDDSLLSADYLNGHFIKTSNYFDGLDETDVQKAMDILNR